MIIERLYHQQICCKINTKGSSLGEKKKKRSDSSWKLKSKQSLGIMNDQLGKDNDEQVGALIKWE